MTNDQLALRFESLGGAGHGCEFGIFQRWCGAEPLGLLRWSDIPASALITALEHRFAGVGDPEYTVLFEPPPGNNDEWWTRDTRYHMAMRTFVRINAAPYAEMLPTTLRRLRFLREKLISDLAEGDKIFVYRVLSRNMTPEEMARLHRAVQTYGANTLMVLQYADVDHAVGTVERVADGLIFGHVEHFRFSRDDKKLAEPFDAFLDICRKAVAIL